MPINVSYFCFSTFTVWKRNAYFRQPWTRAILGLIRLTPLNWKLCCCERPVAVYAHTARHSHCIRMAELCSGSTDGSVTNSISEFEKWFSLFFFFFLFFFCCCWCVCFPFVAQWAGPDVRSDKRAWPSNNPINYRRNATDIHRIYMNFFFVCRSSEPIDTFCNKQMLAKWVNEKFILHQT